MFTVPYRGVSRIALYNEENMSSISVTDEELASMKFVLNLVASTEYKDDGLRLEVEVI